MHILYIHQYFKTPNEPGGTRSYWIAKELIKRGHSVTMITSTSKGEAKVVEKQVDGIKVIYVLNAYNNYMSNFKKIWSFINFVRLAITNASKQKNVDLVFATSTPLTVGLVALYLKWRRGWRYVFEVRDLWPEFPIQIGAIKNKLIIKLLRKFEKRIYDKAEHVIGLSPGMVDGIVAAGTPPQKCSMIPNMSKPDEFYPRTPSVDIAHQFEIDLNKFNVIHFGSMGRANGLEYIVKAAKVLQDRGISDIDFIFMGDGATLPILKSFVKDNGLRNVKFLGNHKMSVVSEVVNCCDASITTFLDLPILYTNSPNKLFDSLSAGKPIIVNSAGWTKDLVEKENCGFYVSPQDAADLADKLMLYYKDKELLKTWGNNARSLSVNVFDKSILSAQVADVIESV